ncbi:TusE/DsrC/DsvC family sulfur relay protein [Thiohalomonas denitrificans]|uniref:TusE/DsrC/DsvC family sulfur relay protein n=1 Tax=Thiohalomonas denitrificans TaxID=415747 RepID=UPI0026EB21C4|nr:TusE/DsrC/DsvC family sulfur relay protein [Thiohalomonas denitrificans]
MIADNSGNRVATDEEGYLIEPGHWDQAVAEHLAAQEHLHLTEEHWKVLRFMRSFYDEHQIAPDARFTIKFLAEELGYGRKARNYLFKLFPYGYVKQACKLAGMKRPRAWSTG